MFQPGLNSLSKRRVLMNGVVRFIKYYYFLIIIHTITADPGADAVSRDERPRGRHWRQLRSVREGERGGIGGEDNWNEESVL